MPKIFHLFSISCINELKWWCAGGLDMRFIAHSTRIMSLYLGNALAVARYQQFNHRVATTSLMSSQERQYRVLFVCYCT